MKQVLLCVVAALACASALKYQMDYLNVNDPVALEAAFDKWSLTFNKEYTRFGHRDVALENFKVNVLKIQTHNAGNHRYHLRMNQFGDLTVEQYRQKVLARPRHVEVPMAKIQASRAAAPYVPGPLSPNNSMTVDWRAKGAVTPVKDQGQCGSCWAFSTTGSIECTNFLVTNKLVSFSEQQLVDCSGSYGNQGCDGGDMGQAMQYVIDTGFLDTEDSYPYVAWDQKCVAKSSSSGGTIYSYINITSASDISLENASILGSVSVAIDASSDDFQFYGGGLYEEAGCSQTDLDHGVLVVGYNYMTFSAKDIVPYWIVKNSWADSWGDDGYIMMRKAESETDGWRNMCGIATDATQPYASKPSA